MIPLAEDICVTFLIKFRLVLSTTTLSSLDQVEGEGEKNSKTN